MLLMLFGLARFRRLEALKTGLCSSTIPHRWRADLLICGIEIHNYAWGQPKTVGSYQNIIEVPESQEIFAGKTKFGENYQSRLIIQNFTKKRGQGWIWRSPQSIECARGMIKTGLLRWGESHLAPRRAILGVDHLQGDRRKSDGTRIESITDAKPMVVGRGF